MICFVINPLESVSARSRLGDNFVSSDLVPMPPSSSTCGTVECSQIGKKGSHLRRQSVVRAAFRPPQCVTQAPLSYWRNGMQKLQQPGTAGTSDSHYFRRDQSKPLVERSKDETHFSQPLLSGVGLLFEIAKTTERSGSLTTKSKRSATNCATMWNVGADWAHVSCGRATGSHKESHRVARATPSV